MGDLVVSRRFRIKGIGGSLPPLLKNPSHPSPSLIAAVVPLLPSFLQQPSPPPFFPIAAAPLLPKVLHPLPSKP
jgi:hypothetical protein